MFLFRRVVNQEILLISRNGSSTAPILVRLSFLIVSLDFQAGCSLAVGWCWLSLVDDFRVLLPQQSILPPLFVTAALLLLSASVFCAAPSRIIAAGVAAVPTGLRSISSS